MNYEVKLRDLQERYARVSARVKAERRNLGLALLAEQPQDAKRAREQLERLELQQMDLELMIEALPHVSNTADVSNPGVQSPKAADINAYEAAKTRFVNEYGTIKDKPILKDRARELLEIAANAGFNFDKDCRLLFLSLRGSPELCAMAPLRKYVGRTGVQALNRRPAGM
jgi:hypothetical protein